jgi:hypothetical protein
MRKLIVYLEQETGEKFSPHGSVKGGATSKNDFDILIKTRSASDEEEAQVRREEAAIWDAVAAGKLTQSQAMEQLYADPGDKLKDSLERIGFRKTREMRFTGNYVERWHRAPTGHTIELWMEGDQGDADSGPPSMWSRDYDPVTGRLIKETR